MSEQTRPGPTAQRPRSWSRLLAPGVLFLAWLAQVVVFSLAHQPGIICLTPVVWLLGAAIGRRAARSAGGLPARTLRLNALAAGALFGALTGLLYGADVAVTAGNEPGTLWFAVWSGGLCILSGAIVCGLLSLAVAALAVRRAAAADAQRSGGVW
jgi:hypothetical protein